MNYSCMDALAACMPVICVRVSRRHKHFISYKVSCKILLNPREKDLFLQDFTKRSFKIVSTGKHIIIWTYGTVHARIYAWDCSIVPCIRIWDSPVYAYGTIPYAYTVASCCCCCPSSYSIHAHMGQSHTRMGLPHIHMHGTIEQSHQFIICIYYELLVPCMHTDMSMDSSSSSSSSSSSNSITSYKPACKEM